ncbi:Hpt domain-containing protein [Aquisphaera insulae]|uniref:Hpt domain-containing protein n=1 Tax=Aquisphaera insulae TaxID=2712864 RepID=UPI0013EC971E|nr:Hpt domain-containing protein [Aquisphaera insulae]
MSSDSGLEDLSLMELFRSEVETHSEVLSSALLVLEKSPEDTARLEPMMRAAHSIKGAARVVGVDVMVGVSHAMEDCFVAAQRGKLSLTPAGIDVLLRGVDLMGKIAEASKDPQADLTGHFSRPVASLVAEIEALIAGGGRTSGPPHSAPGATGPASSQKPTAPGKTTIVFPEILDTAAAERLRRQFLEALECGDDPIRLDLHATQDLDVQGLVLLAAIPRHLARLGRGRLQLSGISRALATVLHATGLDTSYDVRTGPAPEGA